MAFKNLKMQMHRFQGVGGAALRELARLGCTRVGGITKVEATVCSGLGRSQEISHSNQGPSWLSDQSLPLFLSLGPAVASTYWPPWQPLLPALSLAISLKLGPHLSA